MNYECPNSSEGLKKFYDTIWIYEILFVYLGSKIKR